jgi:hypothetical protein
MVGVGVFVCVTAGIRHRAYLGDLKRGVTNPPLPIEASLIMAGILALVGLAIAVHIITIEL